MTPEKAQQLQAHAKAIAAILIEDTPPEQLTTFEGIETAIHQHMLEHVSPEIAFFLLAQLHRQQQEGQDKSKVVLVASPSPKRKRKS